MFAGHYGILVCLRCSELLLLELAQLLYVIHFAFKSSQSLVIDLLQVCHILLTFCLSVIIYFEGTIAPHEAWVRLVMVILRDLLSVQGMAYQR